VCEGEQVAADHKGPPGNESHHSDYIPVARRKSPGSSFFGERLPNLAELAEARGRLKNRDGSSLELLVPRCRYWYVEKETRDLGANSAVRVLLGVIPQAQAD